MSGQEKKKRQRRQGGVATQNPKCRNQYSSRWKAHFHELPRGGAIHRADISASRNVSFHLIVAEQRLVFG